MTISTVLFNTAYYVNVSGTSSTDQSSVIQAVINTASAAGGGTVRLPAGTIFCKNLSLPNNVYLMGEGIGATVLKLPSGANTYLIAQSTYVLNQAFVGLYGGLRHLTLDGNSSNNSSGYLFICRSFRATFLEVAFINAPSHCLVFSNESANGTALSGSGHISDCSVTNCFFGPAVSSAIYATSTNVLDIHINHNIIGTCCSDGSSYGIYTPNGAGWTIVNNGFYNSGHGEVYLGFIGQTIIANNEFDCTSNTVASGTLNSIYVNLNVGNWGNLVISGNIFQTVATSLGTIGTWNLLAVNAAINHGIVVTSNSFFSETIDVTAISYTGTIVGSVQLQALANAYSTHAPKPVDPNINA